MTCSPAGEPRSIRSLHKQRSNCHLVRVGGGAGPGALGASKGAGDGQGKEEMKDALQGERAAQAEASWLRGPREPKGGNVYLERGARGPWCEPRGHEAARLGPTGDVVGICTSSPEPQSQERKAG